MKKYSKKWMQTFVEGKLPEDNSYILEQVSKKGFEVEGFEQTIDGDTLFEIKVLPNRIADAFCVRGMAREFAAVFNLKWGGSFPVPGLDNFTLNNDFLINKSNEGEVPLNIFTGVKISNFDNTIDTPEWIKDIITKSGGRSINCLVDITNLMLFSFGQPAHVFDFEKLNGKIITRFATENEELELLDGKKVKLSTADFVIADEARALSLAGIKGGKFAETTKETRVAFFEMANFNQTMIRKTSTRLNIRTDASKIFENGISTKRTEEALGILLATILEIDKSAKIEFIVNKKIIEKSPDWVTTNISAINNSGGVVLSKDEIVKILKSQNFEVEENMDELRVKASADRLDINIGEDVAEEVLRLYGFDNVKSKPLNLPKTTAHNNRFLLENFLKVSFLNKNYTEVFNYTFLSEGEVRLKAGLAEDKMFLRKNLEEGMKSAFAKNYNYLPIFEKDILKIFEIGTIFGENNEYKNCVISLDDNKKKTKYLPQIEEDLKEILQKLDETLKIEDLKILNKNEKPALLEFSIDALLEILENKNIQIPFLEITKDLYSIKYRPISIYPFIGRDVAVFVPQDYKDFENLKSQLLSLGLINVEKVYKFDEFTKTLEDGSKKTSIAFCIIFQSYEKTLTDTEVETEMQKINEFLKKNNFEIR